MFDWFLMRFHGTLDWLMVIFTVFLIVFICQFMINFMKIDHDSDDNDDHIDQPNNNKYQGDK